MKINLKDAALDAYKTKSEANKKENLLKQQEFVKSIVGEDFYSECIYNEEKGTWNICGIDFACFVDPNSYYGPSKVPALGRWNGFSKYYYAYSMAHIGFFIKEEEEKIKNSNVCPILPNTEIIEEKGLFSWIKKLLC